MTDQKPALIAELAAFEPDFQALETLVGAADGDFHLGDLAAQPVEFGPDPVPERSDLDAQGLEAGAEFFPVAADLEEEGHEQAGDQRDHGPALGVVHHPRIGHAPRAMEYAPCNYRGGTR